MRISPRLRISNPSITVSNTFRVDTQAPNSSTILDTTTTSISRVNSLDLTDDTGYVYPTLVSDPITLEFRTSEPLSSVSVSLAGNVYDAQLSSSDTGDRTEWTVTSDSDHMDTDQTAEFYLYSYTDLAGNTQDMSTTPLTQDNSGYSVLVDDSAPDSTSILDTTTTSISRVNSLDLTDDTGYVYPTLVSDPITLEFRTSEPLSSVSVSLAGNVYDAQLSSSDTGDRTEWTVTSDSDHMDTDQTAEFYLYSYTDLAGNTQDMSTTPLTQDNSGYSVLVDDSAPDSTSILDTTTTSISRVNSLDLTDDTGYVYPTLVSDPITLEFRTSEPLSSVSVSLAGNVYDAQLSSSDTGDRTEWTVTSDSDHMDTDQTAEFYLYSYTDLAGNTQSMSTESQTTDNDGYSVLVDNQLPDSTSILDTTTTSISRVNSLDLTDDTGYVYPTLVSDPITLEFSTSEPLSSVSVSLAGNVYDAQLSSSDTGDRTEWTVTSDSDHMDTDQTAEFYLYSYTDLAGNTQDMSTTPLTQDNSGYSVLVDDSAPDSTSILDTTTTSISRVNSLDLTDDTGYVYPTLVSDPITLEFRTK